MIDEEQGKRARSGITHRTIQRKWILIANKLAKQNDLPFEKKEIEILENFLNSSHLGKDVS